MIRSIYQTPDGTLQTGVRADEFVTLLKEPQGLLWVDIEGEPVEVSEEILRGTFGFHPLAVDDALQESHIPKIDDWGSYLYVVLHAITFDERQPGRLDTLELDIFVGGNYLVTYRERPISAVDLVWQASQRDGRHLNRGPDYLLYKLADELVIGYMPVVEQIDFAIDEIEDRIFVSPESGLVEHIFALKRALLHLRRIIAPQREVFNKLGRDDYEVISARRRVFFRDIYDHLVRLHDLNESLRDLVSGAMETYLSVINNRMNGVMRMLTVITTLFMPVSFLAGFFGMNFFEPTVPFPVWTGLPVFLLVLAIMVCLPVTMFVWMRRRRWM